MDLLRIKHINQQNPEIPCSVSSIVKLPKPSFIVDSFVISDPWIDAVNGWIWRSYLDLVFTGLIRIEYELCHRNLAKGLIKWDSFTFIPTIRHLPYDFSIESWLEGKILDSVDNSKIIYTENSTNLFKEQIRSLIASLIGKEGNFINPWKKIAERIIIKGNPRYWTFDLESKLLKLIQRMKINITEKDLSKYKAESSRIDSLLTQNLSDEHFKIYSDLLYDRIHKEILKRQDLGD